MKVKKQFCNWNRLNVGVMELFSSYKIARNVTARFVFNVWPNVFKTENFAKLEKFEMYRIKWTLNISRAVRCILTNLKVRNRFLIFVPIWMSRILPDSSDSNSSKSRFFGFGLIFQFWAISERQLSNSQYDNSKFASKIRQNERSFSFCSA